MNNNSPALKVPESVKQLSLKLGGNDVDITSTVDLDYCLKKVENLEQSSKFVSVVLNKFTFEDRFKLFRKQLIDNGQIESIILLPNKLFEGTAISATMIVFSNGNDAITVVDASKQYHVENRNKNIFSDDDIDKIMNACYTETNFSKRVSISEIAENNYSLSPPLYILPDLKNPVKFGSLVKSYRCGLQLSPEQQEKVTSDKPTDWQYAQPRSIINGEIDTELPYLSDFRESYLNHQIKNGNVVISKLGSPLKVAVAEFEDAQTVIGVGRLYIFDIDTEKADPYKIKKFLSSSLGQGLLNSCDTSMLMKNLTIDRILKMSVPYDEVKI